MVFWHPYYIKNIEKCEYCLSSFYKPILFDMVYIEYNGFALTCVHSSLYFLCHVFCFICLHTVSCVRCLCLWIVLSLCLVYVACVSGLSCLYYPFSLFRSLMSFDIFQYQISDAGLYQLLMDPSVEKLHLTFD
jgi:hypothetical protein